MVAMPSQFTLLLCNVMIRSLAQKGDLRVALLGFDLRLRGKQG
jgi:hypothetical protein